APTLKYTGPIVVADTTYISAYSKVWNVYSDTIRATYIPEHASSFVGMDWDWPAEYKATLSLTCPRCETKIKPAVSLSEELTKEATEEETGLKTYTATATANKVTYKSTYREVLPRLTQPIHDTVTIIDTITITEVKTDTIIITDTIYIQVETGNTVADPMTVKLYPNPTNESFTVETEEDAYLQIYNAAGACIQSKQLQGGRFTGSLPSSGLYFIKLTSKNRTYTKRLVVK
ncbi:MAG: T9SS type A sorting domain-containing protein, partial [Bacteroidales bacterium]|nr:T9SS type A sorting domain-containing protein [Bacteroidales bacterium]